MKKFFFILYPLFIALCLHITPLTISEILYGMAACTATGDFLPAVNQSPPYVIAIDPGHGGMDTGAQAIVEEHQVIDMTCSYLYQLLDSHPDYIPILTRTDTDPESDRRSAIANAAGAALLISVHANTDSHQSSRGFECFPTPPGRTHHRDSLRFATIIAREMKTAGHILRGGEEKTGVKYAYYNGNSKKIVDSTDDTVRSQKSFGILEKTNCPAVLVEQCFISNYNDVANWTGETGCKKAAEIYFSAIKQFFSAYNQNF